MDENERELTWAGGAFDASGDVIYRVISNALIYELRIASTDPELLKRFSRVVGMVYSPSIVRQRKRTMLHWMCSGDNAYKVARMLREVCMSAKREELDLFVKARIDSPAHDPRANKNERRRVWEATMNEVKYRDRVYGAVPPTNDVHPVNTMEGALPEEYAEELAEREKERAEEANEPDVPRKLARAEREQIERDEEKERKRKADEDYLEEMQRRARAISAAKSPEERSRLLAEHQTWLEGQGFG